MYRPGRSAEALPRESEQRTTTSLSSLAFSIRTSQITCLFAILFILPASFAFSSAATVRDNFGNSELCLMPCNFIFHKGYAAALRGVGSDQGRFAFGGFSRQMHDQRINIVSVDRDDDANRRNRLFFLAPQSFNIFSRGRSGDDFGQ